MKRNVDIHEELKRELYSHKRGLPGQADFSDQAGVVYAPQPGYRDPLGPHGKMYDQPTGNGSIRVYQRGPNVLRDGRSDVRPYSVNPAEFTHFEMNRPNPLGLHGASDQYIILDSYEKTSQSNTKLGEYRWNLMIQGSTGNQMIGIRDSLDTVIEIHVGEFTIPVPPPGEYIVNYDQSVGYPPLLFPNSVMSIHAPDEDTLRAKTTGGPSILDDGIPQLTSCDVITMEIPEVGLQAISDSSGRHHHFELHTSAMCVPSRLRVTPLRRFEIYIFTKPIKELNSISVIFRNPDNRIAFPEDRYENIQAKVGLGDLLTFVIPGNNLAPGDVVVISGFECADQNINRWINNTTGHYVGVGGFVSGSEFQLDPTVSTITLGIPVGNFIPLGNCTTLFIPKNRIRIPMRIRRVIDDATQYHVIGNFP